MVLKEISNVPLITISFFLGLVKLKILEPTTAHMNFTSYQNRIKSPWLSPKESCKISESKKHRDINMTIIV